jgi:hypothetical protein
MAEKAINNGGPLTAEQVKSRKQRSVAENFCFISLRPLTDENRFTIISRDGQFNIDKAYSESVMAVLNK